MKNQKGYAIIETLIFAMIISILASFAVPKVINELKVSQANYLMQSLYSEIRYVQALSRIANYERDTVFGIHQSTYPPYVSCYNSNGSMVVRISDISVARRYILPKNFAFHKDFHLYLSAKGIPNEMSSQKYSGTITLRYNSKPMKPSITFNSVGRFRFSDK